MSCSPPLRRTLGMNSRQTFVLKLICLTACIANTDPSTCCQGCLVLCVSILRHTGTLLCTSLLGSHAPSARILSYFTRGCQKHYRVDGVPPVKQALKTEGKDKVAAAKQSDLMEEVTIRSNFMPPGIFVFASMSQVCIYLRTCVSGLTYSRFCKTSYVCIV